MPTTTIYDFVAIGLAPPNRAITLATIRLTIAAAGWLMNLAGLFLVIAVAEIYGRELGRLVGVLSMLGLFVGLIALVATLIEGKGRELVIGIVFLICYVPAVWREMW